MQRIHSLTSRLIGFFSLIGLLSISTAAFSADGLQNPGFEQGETGWTISADDAYAIVGTENKDNSPVYADYDITVEPDSGSKMLRLGSLPQTSSSQRTKGTNSASQTFTSVTDALVVSFRMFSDDHRAVDTFTLSVKSKGNTNFPVGSIDGGQVTFNMPGMTQTCTQTPCVIKADSGKQGNLVNTGWVKVLITGLPTDGSSVTITYTLETDNNSGLGTWLYADSGNNPPFSVLGLSSVFDVSSANTTEGNIITLVDKSYDTDPGDYISANKWEVYSQVCNCTEIYENKKAIKVVQGDEGVVNVTLTVFDKYGASDQSSSGSNARDGTEIPAIEYKNGKVYYNALNYEALPGTQIELQSRFVDPGWGDDPVVSWDVGNNTISDEKVQLNQTPMILTGRATAKLLVPDTGITGSVLVDDQDYYPVPYQPVSFTVNVIDPAFLATDEGQREPNDTPELAKPLESGSVYLSNISHEGDIDLFRVVKNGQNLPHGSTLFVKLKGLPQDYDVVVLRKVHPDLGTSPVFDPDLGFGRIPVFDPDLGFGRIPVFDPDLGFGRIPVFDPDLGFGRIPVFDPDLGFGRIPIEEAIQNSTLRAMWLRDPLVDPFNSVGLTFDQFPLAELTLETVDDTKVSEKDVSFSELGLASLANSNLQLVAFSANRGLLDDQVMVDIDGDTTDLIIAVVGVNGSFSPAPYQLQIETSRPMDVAIYVGAACTGAPLVSSSDAGHGADSVITLQNYGTNALFVTQAERYSALYGSNEWDKLNAKLDELAQIVGGTVISLPWGIYHEWDTSPCSVDLANATAMEIRKIILAKRTAATNYVTIIGSDKIVPFHRDPDATVVSNERSYTMVSNARPGTASHASLFSGQNLTDDFYADDRQEVTLGASTLYIPKWSISRLVESPSEVVSNIQAFINTGGQLDLQTALVTGYDIFEDSADAIAGILHNSGTIDVTQLIGPQWTAFDLGCEMFGEAAGAGCIKHGLNNFNAHFAHFMAQSSYSFNSGQPDFFFSAEVAQIGTGTDELSGKMGMTNGCHGGYNMPDGDGITIGGVLDPNLDFAQGMNKQGSVYLANTGYGIAGLDTIAGTEKLLVMFTEELLKNPTVGLALTRAKQRYLGSARDAGDITVYTEKSSAQATLYGLPMYSLSPASVAGLFGQTAVQASGGSTKTSQLSITDQGTTQPVPLELVPVVSQSGAGEYFAINGEYQTTATRPVQPKYVSELPVGQAVHDALVLGGTYEDLPGYDPVYFRPTTELTRGASEISFCQEAYWPSRIATTNSLGQAVPASLIVIPAQFICENELTGEGTERIYDSINVEVLRSSINDYVAPNIHSVDLRTSSSGTTLVTIDATDNTPSGVVRIVILLYEDGNITPYDYTISNNGPYTFDLGLDLGSVIDIRKIVIQVADAAGNVSIWTGKGRNMRAIPVYLADGQMISEFSPTTLTSTIDGFTDLANIAETISFIWEFGDSQFQVGTIRDTKSPTPEIVVDQDSEFIPEIVLNQDGSATFSVKHRYDVDTNVVATLKLRDSDGGIGTDDTTLTLCGDPDEFSAIDPNGDLVACDLQIDGTFVTVIIKVADAGVITNDFQYRLSFDYKGKGKSSAPDGNVDLTMKYDNGSFTSSSGLKSLNVQTLDERTIQYTFDLGELGWKGTALEWFAETQSGVQAEKNTGFADRMPDTGTFGN